MKAYLIDPFAKTVTEVEYRGDYHEIYALIDAPAFDVAIINNHMDTLFVDDEGMLKKEGQAYFIVYGSQHPFAGKAVMLGTDKEGDSVSPIMALQELKDCVKWINQNYAFGLRDYNTSITKAAALSRGMEVTDLGHGGLFITAPKAHEPKK